MSMAENADLAGLNSEQTASPARTACSCRRREAEQCREARGRDGEVDVDEGAPRVS